LTSDSIAFRRDLALEQGLISNPTDLAKLVITYSSD